jgi:hypothetical protein
MMIMKTTKNIFKLFLLSLVFLACNAEDPASLDADLHPIDEDTPPVSAGTFTANIDGAPYEIEIATATVQDGVITITGVRGNETVTLRMPSNVAPNSVTNPYILGGAEATYAGFYNTTPGANGSLADVSEATTRNNLQMSFDDNMWVTDAATANIFGGTTTIKSLKSAHVNTGNIDSNGDPIFVEVTQEVRMDVQTSISGTFQFGAANVAYYSAGGAGGDIFETDMTVDNGNVTLDIDTDNKLISGTFNFDGTETYTSTGTPLTGNDTDGDGMFDGAYGIEGTEVGLGYNPNDACSPIMPAGYTGYDATNATWLAADCDGDGTSNADELTAGTDPYEGNIDTDGDGVSDAQEGLDGTDAADACDPSQVEFYTNYESTNPTWAAADCDSDTVINADELTNGTNPYFMDYLTKSFTEGEFTYVPYTDVAGPTARRGLNVSTHDIANKHITGTYNFISASVGEDPIRWYLITDGTFDVTYSVPE